MATTATASESCATFQFETTRRLATLRAPANPPAGATGPILLANNGNQMPAYAIYAIFPVPSSQFPYAWCRMPYSNATANLITNINHFRSWQAKHARLPPTASHTHKSSPSSSASSPSSSSSALSGHFSVFSPQVCGRGTLAVPAKTDALMANGMDTHRRPFLISAQCGSVCVCAFRAGLRGVPKVLLLSC